MVDDWLVMDPYSVVLTWMGVASLVGSIVPDGEESEQVLVRTTVTRNLCIYMYTGKSLKSGRVLHVHVIATATTNYTCTTTHMYLCNNKSLLFLVT